MLAGAHSARRPRKIMAMPAIVILVLSASQHPIVVSTVPAQETAWCGRQGKRNRSTAWGMDRRIAPMQLRIQCLCVDTADPARLAAFWQSALGWRRTFERDDEVVLEPPQGSAEDGVVPGFAVPAGS